MRFDLERAGPAVADVNDAGVLARPLQYQLAACGQPFEMDARGLIGAVFAPHHAVNAKFGPGRRPAECSQYLLIFVRSDAVFGYQLRRDLYGVGGLETGGHGGNSLFSRLPGPNRGFGNPNKTKI